MAMMGLKSFTDAELLMLMKDANMLCIQKPKCIAQLIGLDMTMKTRLIDILQKNKMPATDAELEMRMMKAMNVLSTKKLVI